MRFRLNILFLVIATINTNAQQTQDPQIQAAETEILGEWVSADDASSKIVFYSNGENKGFYNGELIYTYHYNISRVCNPGQMTLDNRLMLITIDENGNKLNCDIIQALNENNSGILSITTEGQGKLVVYERP